MKRFLFLVICCTLFIGANSVKAALTWADEFNSISGWTYMVGPNDVNGELQYYQSGGNNSWISNGTLCIQARQQSVGGKNYTSARMNKGNFLYGFFEGRMTIPQKQGSWPAFWLLGTNIGSVGWPKCGEIDIMEQVNTGTDIHSSLHWDNGGYKTWTAIRYISNPQNFHLYQCNWNMYGFKFYVDGVQIGSWVGSASGNGMNDNGMEEFRRNHFMILNLAVGGFWPGNNIQGMPWYMYVDYVRQYTPAAKKSGTELEPEPIFNADGSFSHFSNEGAPLSAETATVSNTNMYPNPLTANAILKIKLGEYDPSQYVNVSIYDMKGSLVFNKLETTSELSVNAGLKAGMYNVKVTNGKNVSFNKLLVR